MMAGDVTGLRCGRVDGKGKLKMAGRVEEGERML